MTFPPRVVDLTAGYRLGIADSGGGNPCNQLVYHFTVSGSAPGVARALVGAVQRGEAGGATQVYVDAAEVVITGPPRRKYWSTGSALGHNATTYGIEICGGVGSGSNGNPYGPDDTWTDPDTDAGRALVNAAWWGARACHEYEIEPRLLTVAETRDPNRSGITTHYRISIADGPGGSDHVDWDDTEPVGYLLQLTKQFYDQPGASPILVTEDGTVITDADIAKIARAVWSYVEPDKGLNPYGYPMTNIQIATNGAAFKASGLADALKPEVLAKALANVLPASGPAAVSTEALAGRLAEELAKRLAE